MDIKGGKDSMQMKFEASMSKVKDNLQQHKSKKTQGINVDSINNRQSEALQPPRYFWENPVELIAIKPVFGLFSSSLITKEPHEAIHSVNLGMALFMGYVAYNTGNLFTYLKLQAGISSLYWMAFKC